MRATLLYGAGDVRVETVPDAGIVEPTDALITVTHACVCGSDLWPYKSTEPTRQDGRWGTRRSVSSRRSAPTSAR